MSLTGNGLFMMASWPSLATALQDLWTTGTPPPPRPRAAAGGHDRSRTTFAIRSESPNPAPPFPSLDAFAYRRAGPRAVLVVEQRGCASWRATAADRSAAPGTGAPRTRCSCSKPPPTLPPRMKARSPCRNSWPGTPADRGPATGTACSAAERLRDALRQPLPDPHQAAAEGTGAQDQRPFSPGP